MNKMKYSRPTADLVLFDNEDIITASSGCDAPFEFSGYWTKECDSLMDGGPWTPGEMPDIPDLPSCGILSSIIGGFMGGPLTYGREDWDNRKW